MTPDQARREPVIVCSVDSGIRLIRGNQFFPGSETAFDHHVSPASQITASPTAIREGEAVRGLRSSPDL
jgi:hypothetical protein